MIDPLIAGTGALVGGAAGGLAFDGRSYFHDALRPLARDIRSGAISRREAAGYGWSVSYRFLLWYSLPFTVLTGTVVSHLVLLPADVIGLGSSRRWASVALAAGVGACVFAGAEVIPQALDGAPVAITEAVTSLTDPVLWLYPAVPLVAALKLPQRFRCFSVVLLFGACGALACVLIDASDAVAAVGALAGLGALVAFQLRRRGGQDRLVTSDLKAADAHVRAGLPLLVLVAGGVAVLAEAHRIAGDPMTALLIAQGHELDAAAVTLLSFAAFFPLAAVSGMTSDSYSTQGTPDWIPGAGYVSPTPWVALLVGPLLMVAEVLAAPRSFRLILKHPVISEVAAAVREAIGDIVLLALLFGGLLMAEEVAGEIGFLAVGIAWLVNENFDKPIMRFAVAPVGAIAVGVAANIWEVVS